MVRFYCSLLCLAYNIFYILMLIRYYLHCVYRMSLQFKCDVINVILST